MVFCHTDLHNWNLMQSKNILILIDWEGLKVAPPEADLMFLKEKPYYKCFLDIYQEKHPDFQVNSDSMEFYLFEIRTGIIFVQCNRICIGQRLLKRK